MLARTTRRTDKRPKAKRRLLPTVDGLELRIVLSDLTFTEPPYSESSADNLDRFRYDNPTYFLPDDLNLRDDGGSYVRAIDDQTLNVSGTIDGAHRHSYESGYLNYNYADKYAISISSHVTTVRIQASKLSQATIRLIGLKQPGASSGLSPTDGHALDDGELIVRGGETVVLKRSGDFGVTLAAYVESDYHGVWPSSERPDISYAFTVTAIGNDPLPQQPHTNVAVQNVKLVDGKIKDVDLAVDVGFQISDANASPFKFKAFLSRDQSYSSDDDQGGLGEFQVSKPTDLRTGPNGGTQTHKITLPINTLADWLGPDEGFLYLLIVADSDNQLPAGAVTQDLGVVDLRKDLAPLLFKDDVVNAMPGPADGTTITASFTPNYGLTLGDAAWVAGYDHFNWVQVVVSDPTRSKAKWDTPVEREVGPYLDPPLGGYASTHFYKAEPHDRWPYYYEEGRFGSSEVGHIESHTKTSTLTFFDRPTSPVLFDPKKPLIFATMLVGVSPVGVDDQGHVKPPDLGKFGILNVFSWSSNTAIHKADSVITVTGGVNVLKNPSALNSLDSIDPHILDSIDPEHPISALLRSYGAVNVPAQVTVSQPPAPSAPDSGTSPTSPVTPAITPAVVNHTLNVVRSKGRVQAFTIGFNGTVDVPLLNDLKSYRLRGGIKKARKIVYKQKLSVKRVEWNAEHSVIKLTLRKSFKGPIELTIPGLPSATGRFPSDLDGMLVRVYIHPR